MRSSATRGSTPGPYPPVPRYPAVGGGPRGTMRRTYTCLLELAEPTSAAPRVARALPTRWVGQTYGGWPEHAPEQWQPAPGVSVRWRLLDDPQRADEAFELVWTRVDASDPSLSRRTTVQITTTDQDGRVLVQEQLESADPKVRA